MIGFPYMRARRVASHIDTDATGAELEELTDGSETALHSHAAGTPAAHTIASHSDTTATGTELETLTDGSETALHSHAAAAGGGALSAYAFDDTDSQNLERDHAYLAQTDGMVFCYNVAIDAAQVIRVYVGTTNDPVGAGVLIQENMSDGTNRTVCVCALVAEGEYFEITGQATGGYEISWKSFGTLAKPIDQD